MMNRNGAILRRTNKGENQNADQNARTSSACNHNRLQPNFKRPSAGKCRSSLVPEQPITSWQRGWNHESSKHSHQQETLGRKTLACGLTSISHFLSKCGRFERPP
jgi:hypothetical protein